MTILIVALLVAIGVIIYLATRQPAGGTVVTPPPAPVTGGPSIVCVLIPGTDSSWLGSRTFEEYVTGPLQEYVDKHFAPVWNLPCRLSAGAAVPLASWGLIFSNDADVANALGYHDVTAAGLPIGKVFVATTLGAGDDVSVTASHELAEMLGDPGINLSASRVKGADPTFYAYETADAVEESSFDVGGFQMSDFVLPEYFEDFWPRGTRRDYMGILPGLDAFEIAPGGYMAVFRNGNWTQIFGSKEKAMRFAHEDRRDHRTDLRQRREEGEAFVWSTT